MKRAIGSVSAAIIALPVLFTLLFGATYCKAGPDFKSMIFSQIAFNRAATNKMLDEIEKIGGNQALAWRAGPGRAPIGWHIMHVAASEDRMGGKVLADRGLVSDKWALDFKSGKPAGDSIPDIKEVRKYLSDSRTAIEKSIADFDLGRLDEMTAPDSQNSYRRMFQIIEWHEPHHQGQALATFNLYKAAHGVTVSTKE